VLAAERKLDRPARDAVVMVTLALPVVWYFQFTGGAVPQWGGRYVLTSGLVLAAVGVGAAGRLDRFVHNVLVGLSIGVAVFGLAWMSHRTHEISRAADTVGAIDVPVVSAQAFWLRELGSAYRPDSRWLSVAGLKQVPAATAVLDSAGEREFELLWSPVAQNAPAPTVDGWRPTGLDRSEHWLGANFRLTRYERQ
jgi:hypothetical protein